MGNNLRCCLACVLPCGALDLIRIVHLSGRVDEYGRAVSAGEILAAHPNHVLSRPCSSRQGAVGRRILILSPESELERGEIYFLIPAASVPDGNKRAGAVAGRRHVRGKSEGSAVADRSGYGSASTPEKTAQQQQHQHRRRMSTGSHASPWQPHLACIAEDP